MPRTEVQEFQNFPEPVTSFWCRDLDLYGKHDPFHFSSQEAGFLPFYILTPISLSVAMPYALVCFLLFPGFCLQDLTSQSVTFFSGDCLIRHYYTDLVESLNAERGLFHH